MPIEIHASSDTPSRLTAAKLQAHAPVKCKVFKVEYNGEMKRIPGSLPDSLTLTHVTVRGAGPSRDLAHDVAGHYLLEMVSAKREPIGSGCANAFRADELRQKLSATQSAKAARVFPIYVKILKNAKPSLIDTQVLRMVTSSR